MGNLPGSRTVNANPSDAVSSALADEMQDCIIGAKRKLFWRNFYPSFTLPGTFFGGIATVAGHNVHAYVSPGGASTSLFGVPFDDGDTLVGLKYWASGNGTVDLTSGLLFYGATMTVDPTQIASWTDTNRAAAFGILDIGVASLTFPPTLLAAGGSLFVQLVTNAAGYNIGPWWAGFTRL